MTATAIDIASIRLVLENIPADAISPMHRILALHARSLSIEYNECAADLLLLATLATYSRFVAPCWRLRGCSEIRPGQPPRGETRPHIKMLAPAI